MENKFKQSLKLNLLIIFFILLIILFINLILQRINQNNLNFINDIEKKIFIIEKSFSNIYFDRIFKNNLAQFSSGECYLLGSSQHVSLDKNLIKEKNCNNVVNLSLQGATLEDFFINIYFLLQNNKSIKKVLIGIEPPLFVLDYDPMKRWSIYKKYFFDSIKMTNINFPNRLFIKNFSDLFSLSFVLEKIKIFNLRNSFSKKFVLLETKKVKRPYFNSLGILQNPNQMSIDHDLDMAGFTDDFELYHLSQTKDIFDKLIDYLLKKNIEVEFIILPYRQDVFSQKSWSKDINDTFFFLKSLKEKYNIKILGSFEPKSSSCSYENFIDRSHPKLICIESILR